MTSYGDLSDIHRHYAELAEHRARVFEALSRHSDPVVREMGRQLASGTVAPHELFREPRYVEVLQRTMRQLNELDDDELRARVFPQDGRSDPDTGEDSVPAGRR